MFELKLKSGASVQEVSEFLTDCLNEAISLHRESDPATGLDLYSLAGVMRSWHTDTAFLKPDGLPRPLPVNGTTSLKRLISIHFPKGELKSVFAKLRNNDLIKRHGERTWLPSERHARVPKATTETLSHLAEGVGRLAETVMRNIQTPKKQDLLFERGCKVFHLPISESKAFREYLQKQGVSFIMAVDDWLETRAVSTSDRRKKTCAAGAFAFAFIDDEKIHRRATQQKRKGAK